MPQLLPHQERAVRESPDKWALWFRMRVGKTPTAIALADSRARTALVVCPKSLRSQWEREIGRWSDGKCAFTVMTKEEMRKNHKSLPPVEAIIVDEAHMAFGNHRSQTFKAMRSYILRAGCRYVWLLSGTPYTSTPWCAYSYGILLGKDWSWKKWEDAFFAKVRMGPRWIPVPRKDMDDQLQSILRSIGTVVDLKDVAEVAEDTDIVEEIELTDEQKAAIALENDPVPVVRYVRVHQIEQGSLRGNDFEEPKTFPSLKTERVVELCSEVPKTLVVTRYLSQLDALAKALTEAGHTVYRISGKEASPAGDVALQAENCERCVVVAQADTCAGYSLASFDRVVFASMSYSFVNYDQMRSRVKSMQRKRGCEYWHLVSEGDTVDRGVYDSVMRKQDFSIELFATGRG